MIYQIFYDKKSRNEVSARNGVVTPFGVYRARELNRQNNYLYDDVLKPNLAEHNTLCEWRVMYYIWKHHRSEWVGFTSWSHDKKPFQPKLDRLTADKIKSLLSRVPVYGFCTISLRSLMQPQFRDILIPTLKNQFNQYYLLDNSYRGGYPDTRGMPLGRYHDLKYWDFVISEFKKLYSIDLEQELDWDALSRIDFLHTWCNAFVARWSYFDTYMKIFAPIALALLKHFGSHPTDLELSYICERLIIIYNYLLYSKVRIRVSRLSAA